MRFRYQTGPRGKQNKVIAWLIVVSILATVGMSGVSAGEVSLPTTMDASELVKGMEGYGLTVFEGTRVERFDVRIEGVMHNRSTKTDLILARCSGGPLEKTGVIAGMSGSPIYVEDKLIGALAYAWGFSKEAIAGITPISAMLPVLELPTRETSPASPKGSAYNYRVDEWMQQCAHYWAGDYDQLLHVAPPTHWGQMAGLPAPGESISGPSFGTILPQPMSVNVGWTPLGMPLLVNGAGAELMAQMSNWLGNPNLIPVQSGMSAGQSTTASDIPIEPGSALGVALVGGDLKIQGIGTVTYCEGDRLVAFGHPMFSDGLVDLPMTSAFIHLLMANQNISFKMGSAVEVVGALQQDRPPGVAGTLGATAVTIPVEVKIKHSTSGVVKEYAYEVANHRFYSARFARIALIDALESVLRVVRDSSIDYRLVIHLEGWPALQIEDSITSRSGVVLRFTSSVASMVDLLMRNPFEPVQIQKIEASVTVNDRYDDKQIDSITVNRRRVNPGQEIQLVAAVRNYQGGIEEYSLPLIIPETTPPGPLKLQVSDAIGYLVSEQQRNPDRFRPRDLPHLLDLLGQDYRADELFVRLSSEQQGASASGQELPALPASVLRVMLESGDRGTELFLQEQQLVFKRWRMAQPINGDEQILLMVEEPEKALLR